MDKNLCPPRAFASNYAPYKGQLDFRLFPVAKLLFADVSQQKAISVIRANPRSSVA
jgi:hypothetical protein